MVCCHRKKWLVFFDAPSLLDNSIAAVLSIKFGLGPLIRISISLNMLIQTVVHEERDQALRVAKVQKKVLQQQSLKSGFRSAESVVADRAIANYFYANGLNFSAADATTGSYYREMVSAIQSVPETYTPPASEKLVGKLLSDAHGKMADDVQQRDQQGELSSKFGVTYTSDGWDSCDNLPLINSAYILANDGGVYQRRTTSPTMLIMHDRCALISRSAKCTVASQPAAWHLTHWLSPCSVSQDSM